MNNTRDKIKELEKEKRTRRISITLSNKILSELEKEQKRLDIKSRSFLIEMILTDYFRRPIPDDTELNKKKGES